MQLRTSAESVAFQDGGPVEKIYTSRKMDQLIQVQHTLFLKQYPLNISVNTFNYLGSIVSFFVLAIPIFSGRYDDMAIDDLSTLISQNAFVSIYLISCFSKLVGLSENFVTLAGTTHRIAQLENALLKLLDNDNTNEEHKVVNETEESPKGANITEGPLININSLSYRTMDSCRLLVANLSLELCIGDNVLIVGSSGCGKTTLLRILKGLWMADEGSFYIHFWQRAFFVPQKPLLTDGTLRQQIIYPYYTGTHLMTTEDQSLLMQYLELAELTDLYQRSGGLDNIVDWNWYDVLSPGEIQRLCFIRVLYHKPLIALLDEALSAVGTDMEERLYQKCKDLNITVLSIGHRKTLMSYHNLLLAFGRGGSWHLERIK